MRRDGVTAGATLLGTPKEPLLLRLFLALQLVAWAAVGCSGPREAVPAATESSEAPSPQDAFPEAVRAAIEKPFKGDFESWSRDARYGRQ